MIARFCVLGLFALLNTALTKEDEEMSVKERVKFLKFQLEDELKERMKKKENVFLREVDAEVLNANYDYVDLSQVPVTPINDQDDRKKNDRFKLRQLATKPKSTTTWTRSSSWLSLPKLLRDRVDYVELPTPTSSPLKLYNPLSDENIAKQEKGSKVAQRTNNQKEDSKPAKSAIQPHSAAEKPVETFYKQRRLLQDEAARDTKIQWTHCEDMITPFLTGMKGSLNMPLILGPTHRTVLRLVHLLNTDVSQASKEDIYSLMYQISNVQIRLFQWDGAALSLLFDVICKGKSHSYLNIKRGLKHIFDTWHLDISNTTNLLAQSRLFRPACVNAQNLDGSTKSSKGTRYTKPGHGSTTPKCDEDE